MLRCRDGLFTKREARFDKVAGLKRLIIVGHSGSISVKALRWLRDANAAFVQLGHDGEMIAASVPPGSDDARLRRSQALAPFSPAGLKLMRDLLLTKLAGQAQVARSFRTEEGRDAADRIDVAAQTLEGIQTIEDLRGLEAHAARTYWQLWESVPVHFARRDQARVPPRWQAFGSRLSPLSQSERHAVTPGNSILNYLYSILASETTLALRIAGLDPVLGLLHADLPNRDSFTFDVVEPLRPAVDAWLYQFLRQRAFNKHDFGQVDDGSVRCTIGITHELSATAPLWRAKVGAVVEKVARILMDSYRPDAKLPTNLTGARRRAGRFQPVVITDPSAESLVEVALAGTDDQVARNRGGSQRVKLAATCVECGQPLSGQRKRFCGEECQRTHQREFQRAKDAARRPFTRQAPESDQSTTFENPSQAPQIPMNRKAHPSSALHKRRQGIADRANDRAVWEEAHPEINLTTERQRYTAEILPRLDATRLPVQAIRDALGVSTAYASQIRRGVVVPHPLYYAALVRLLDLSKTSPTEVN
jgi:CRISPR-associated protein Cas1